MTTWRQMISTEMRYAEDPGPLLACTLTEEQLDAEISYDF